MHAFKEMQMNIDEFDMATNSQIFKCLVQSQMEYAIGILPLRKTAEIRQLQVLLNEGTRMTLGIWNRGVNAEALMALLKIEDMRIR